MALNPNEDPGYQQLQQSVQAEEALLRAEIQRKRGALQSRFLRQFGALQDTSKRGLENVKFANEARGMARSGRALRDVGRYQADLGRRSVELGLTSAEAQADLGGVLERALIQNRRRLNEAEMRARERLALETAQAGLEQELMG